MGIKDDMANWYVTLGGTELGPIDDAQLRDLAGTGKLMPDELVRKDGMAKGTQARNIKGLFPADPPPPPVIVKSTGGPPPLVTPNVDLFSTWYRDHPGRWAKPLQCLAWVFYGFIWIPAWWGWTLTKANDASSRAKGKKVLGAAVTGAILFTALAVAGRKERPAGSRPIGGIFASAAPTESLTIDEFRQQISGRDFIPKESFYRKYGKPLRTTTIGDDVWLVYRCKDGTVKVMCPAGPFQYQDDIAPIWVDPMY